MKRIFAGAVAALCTAAGAAELRDLGAVSMADFAAETQQMQQSAEALAVVWWIPTEFWIAAILQNDAENTQALKEIRAAFADYVLVGVVEGKRKAIGGFDFLPRESVTSRLRVHSGRIEFLPVERPHKDARLVTDSMKPVLTSMLGELGAHFHLVLLSSEKQRSPSPYEPGTLRVTLAGPDGGEARTFEFNAPLNSLHVPRTCPNGRPADISWKFCPWDGSRLAD